jgi:prepilin-type N-terminal cleavage/methylation domain-containing protein/prepilin-type processing-associated H-X9-DG protein
MRRNFRPTAAAEFLAGVRAAFTLVEMLVVIVILVILAGLLFVVYSAAKERSRRGVCASNLHQIGVAGSMYAEDHDGLFPPYTNGYGSGRGATPDPKPLFDAMAAYLARDSRAWFCPSDPLAGQHTPNQMYLPGKDVGSPGIDHFYTSYVFIRLASPPPNRGVMSFTPPAFRIWAFDDTFGGGIDFQCGGRGWMMGFLDAGWHKRGAGGNHSVGANCLFVDGRVKFYRPGEVIGRFDYPPCEEEPSKPAP